MVARRSRREALSLFGRVRERLEAKMAGTVIATVLKRAAEGKLGALPQKIYWAVAGAKTWTAVVIGFLSYVAKAAVDSGLCAHLGFSSECDVVGQSIAQAGLWSAAALAFVGQVDGGLRTTSPKKG